MQHQGKGSERITRHHPPQPRSPQEGGQAPRSPPGRGELEARLCPQHHAWHEARGCGFTCRTRDMARHGEGVAQEGMLMAGQHVPPSVDSQELPQALLGGGQQREKPRGHLLAPPGERFGHEHRSHRLPPQHYEGGGRLRGTPSGAGMGRGVARGGQAAAVSAATRSPRDGQRGSEGSDGCTWPGPPPARPHGHPSGTRVPISPSAWDGPALSHRGVTAGPGSCHRHRGC